MNNNQTQFVDRKTQQWLRNVQRNLLLLAAVVAISLPQLSCKKDWLDAKPENSLVVPTKISDYQAMLDNSEDGSAPFNKNTNVLGEIGGGDFYVSDDSWSHVSSVEKNSYIWAKDIYGSDKGYSIWESAYFNIFYSNLILEGIEKITPSNGSESKQWDQVKGSALFFRAFRHYEMAQTFCKPYDLISSKNDLGIPLRLKSDITIKSTRSTVEETYTQIIEDLKAASKILPFAAPNSTTYKLRPTQAAAYAMLSRVYLSMANYDSALVYSNKSLGIYSTLMDYGSNPGGFFSIQAFNDEVILHMTGALYPIIDLFTIAFDSTVYATYDDNDRRKDIFWFELDGGQRYIGSYAVVYPFTGLATDEIFLTRAECLARLGNKDAALNDINTLLETRWSNTVPYSPFTSTDQDEIIRKVILERRKELFFRGVRWSDLRRLNKEPQFAITLTRIINGQTYTLPPNSPLYVLPIPPDVVTLTGMQQNPR